MPAAGFDAAVMEPSYRIARYTPLPSTGGAPKYLVAASNATFLERRYEFFARLDIGRDEAGREATPGWLLLPGATVSWNHCTITQNSEGRCFVRDASRNGTRIDGRRLAPNVETEILVGQTLTIGAEQIFRLSGEPPADLKEPGASASRPSTARVATVSVPSLTVVTVLVGDIRDYTVLVRKAPSAALQRSVGRVFEVLTEGVSKCGGTVKEFQGDAIVAFWGGDTGAGHAVMACRAAVLLDRIARDIASDPSIWELPELSLRMDWALATGPVIIDSFGGTNPLGLFMIGEPVVLAFRIEKLAADDVRIVACRETRERASREFAFRDLGEISVKGFDQPDHVFALELPPSL
jgi:class 3 adenylate cyclase